jgi:hypothetical protein
MHEATVREPAQKSHQVAPVRVRQSDPVLVAREEARAVLRKRRLCVRRDQQLRGLIAGNEFARALEHRQARPVGGLEVVTGSVHGQM